MWIFGYGSLMYDGWEKDFSCVRREEATLLGYERSFTKASTLNWGSKKYPAPTLRVIPREGAVCHGVAFEFVAATADKVIAYLQDREGRNFRRSRVVLNLTNAEVVDGECFFYDGKNVIAEGDLDQVATMVLKAIGKDGTGLDYLRRTKRALDDMGIYDENVDALFAAVSKRLQSMKLLVHEKLAVGDIILTTTNSPISYAIRLATKGDISHAMLYVDTCSVVDATLEGVHARNTQRILIEDDHVAHVLRLKGGLNPQDGRAVCDFMRARVGTQYTVKEAIRAGAGGSDTWSRKQFCSRLVAQAYASVGIRLVPDENYCSPNDILRSDLLEEISDVTRPATEDDLWFKKVTDIPKRMRDTTNAFLKSARAKDGKIQDINDVLIYLQANPSDDDCLLKALMESGYLTVWQIEIDEFPWHYDLVAMEAIPDTEEVQQYCIKILDDAGQSRRRQAINATEHERLFQQYPLKTFEALRDLHAVLLDLLHARRYVAATWLARHAPNALDPIIHVPHTPEWFTEYEIEEPKKAVLTRNVISMAGRDDVCSICGDDPAADYRRAGPILPGILTLTLRLCDDCLKIREKHHHERYVPL